MTCVRQKGIANWFTIIVGLIVAICISSVPASAQDTLRGVALVIGNGEYEHLNPLANPPDDADAIEELLSDLGFDSVRRSDRDAKDLARDLERFVEDAQGADVAVLYYAGHGIEASGENFLIPVDADISALDDAAQKLVPVSDVLRRLRETVAVTIILLDACRDNPFPPDATLKLTAGAEALPIAAGGLAVAETRGATALAQTSDPAAANDNFDAVIGFAASPGQVALDGAEGEHSPYAAALIRHIDAMAGQEFGTVMRMVAEEVYLKTGGRQRPWVNESLRRLLYFGDTPDPVTGPDGEILTERRSLLLTISGLSDFSRQQIERVAGQGGVPMDALYGMLKALGQDVPDDPAELEQLLRQQAEELKSFLAERRIIENPDPELARLSALSDNAIADGAISTAQRLRDEVDRRIDELSAVIDREEDNIRNRRLEFAAEYAKSAEIAALAFDHDAAAAYYEKAFQQVDRWDSRLAWQYRGNEIRQLLSHNDAIGNPEAIDRAAQLAPELVGMATGFGKSELAESRLAQASVQSAIAARNLDLGSYEYAAELIKSAIPDMADKVKRADALKRLGAVLSNIATVTGNNTYFDEALDAFHEAQTFISPAQNPQEWLGVSSLLANVTSQIAFREMSGAKLRQAIAILEQAKDLLDVERNPIDRMAFELQLAALHLALPEIESEVVNPSVKLADSVIAELLSSRQRIPREQFPNMAARMDAMIGFMQFERSLIDGDSDALAQSIASMRNALLYRTRERSPADWAETNEYLGKALNTSASKSQDPKEYQLAVTALNNALTVVNPADSPLRWGQIRFQLGFALRGAGIVASNVQLLQKSREVIREALKEPAIAGLPVLIADLHLQLGYTLGRLYDANGEIAHLEEALRSFETASKTLDPASNRKTWMDAQHGIADTAYRLSSHTSDTAYLRRSVEASLRALEYYDRTDRDNFGAFSYEIAAKLETIAQRDGDTDARRRAIALFDDATANVDAADDPVYYADIVSSRANALAALDRIETGKEIFDKARRDYETAIDLYSRANREAEARNRRNLGLLYRNHDRLMQTRDWQDEALATFMAAVETYGEPTSVAAQADLFRAHYNVGETLADQSFIGADATHLREIVAAFSKAVAIPAEIAEPVNWADGQHQLGRALYELALTENDIASFENARKAFEASLTVRTPNADIGGWVGTQTAIADVEFQLGYRTTGVSHYEEALSIYQAVIDNYPAQWTNMGAAHYQMKKANAQYLIGDRAKDVERLRGAINTYRIALDMAHSEDALDFKIGVGQNLGKTLNQVAAATNDFGVYREAANAYRTVLALIPDQGAEQLRAQTQRDLGLILSGIADAGGDMSVVDEAIESLDGAASYFTRQSEPATWAYLINNRAWLNIVAGRRDGDASRFDRAATSLREVVAVQRDVQDLGNLAYSEDSLCAALVELGAAKNQKSLLQEAVAICSHAVELLRSQNLNTIAEGTEKLLAHARASLSRLAAAQP